jgi:hypothetical protein
MIPDLEQRVAYWQKALKLLDWTLDVRCVPDLCNSAGQPVYGLCMPIADNKTAAILIRDPETPVGSNDLSVDERLIHELGHCHLAPLKLVAPADVAVEENTVWAFAGALARASGTPDEAKLARAMVACLAVQRPRAAVAVVRRSEMDEKLMKALKAAMAAEGVSADDKAAIKCMVDDAEKSDEDKKKEAAAKAAKAAESEAPHPPAPGKDETKDAKGARAPITAADAERIARTTTDRALVEHQERSALITENAERMTPAQVRLFGRLPLEQVKEQLAALPTKEATAERIRAQAPPGAGRGGSGNPAAREAVARLMGIETAPPQPVQILGDGSLSISNIGQWKLDDARRA